MLTVLNLVRGRTNQILFTYVHFYMAVVEATTIVAGCGGDPGACQIIQFLQCHGTAVMAADCKNIATLYQCFHDK